LLDHSLTVQRRDLDVARRGAYGIAQSGIEQAMREPEVLRSRGRAVGARKQQHESGRDAYEDENRCARGEQHDLAAWLVYQRHQ
jgi:hypothetical protein